MQVRQLWSKDRMINERYFVSVNEDGMWSKEQKERANDFDFKK